MVLKGIAGSAADTITTRSDFDNYPDLIVTDVWNEDHSICYQLHNAGKGTAPKGHCVILAVDGSVIICDLIEKELQPNERTSRCFPQYTLDCTSFSVDVTVCADGYQEVAESDETNNCRSESWQCDLTPPVIISGPLASQIDPYTVDISWSTDCDCDSRVIFGTRAGVFSGQAENQQATKKHSIRLENLLAATTYHCRVQSTDAAGNTTESKDFFFQTSSPPDNTFPVIAELKTSKSEGKLFYYKASVQLDDNTVGQRVEFFLDGKLVFTDYSEPFECQLAPVNLELSREEFFAEHTLTARAVNQAGMTASLDSIFTPAYECADIRADIQTPSPNETYYIEGDTVPGGTAIPIRVYAAITELDCFHADMSGMPPGAAGFFCTEANSPVSEVRFYVNTALISTMTPTVYDDGLFIFEHDWDISGKLPGTYVIRVDAVADEECIQTVTNTFTIEKGVPHLNVTREVTRTGNYFEVALHLQNHGTASITLNSLTDSVDGFQPVSKIESEYSVAGQASSDGRHCSVEIDFVGGSYALGPGRTIWVSYLAIPVVYPPDEAAADYLIGAEPVRVFDTGGADPSEFDRPCVLTEDDLTLSSEVDLAIRSSDYLIVTNPDKLFSLSADALGVNRLLAFMAELAGLRNGILGYLHGPEANDTGWIRDCIQTWGTPMKGMDGADAGYLSNGYLLLVGEIEIIPSFTKRTRYRLVHCADMSYGNTSGGINPELSVGRIVGDDPWELIVPIEASVKVIKGDPDFTYYRSDAFIVSGRGDGVSEFEYNLDQVGRILDDEFIVTSRKQRDVENSGGDIKTEFKINAVNKDLLFFRDHGNPTSWSDVVETGDFDGGDPVNFGIARPVVFACCCQAGQYEDDTADAADSTNIAEAFLQHGAPSYIGATENSFREQNNSAARWFYNHWVNTGKPAGETFKDLKIHLSGDQGDYWSYEYNLYGDPKYGGSEVELAARSSKTITLPDSPYNLVVPDYEVDSLDDKDHVTIPGGNMLLEEDKPAVPYYKVRIDFPEGYAVDDVILQERSEPLTATGLNIPISDMGEDGSTIGAVLRSSGDSEWWPAKETAFEYDFETRPDRISVLTLTVYPFYYNSLTTDVLFFKTYTFDIIYNSSEAGITHFTTEKENYAAGEKVQADLRLTGSQNANDLIIEVVVKEESSDEVVDGLLLRTLDSVTPAACCSLEWDTGNIPAGTYYLDAKIRNSSGNLIGRRRKTISLGMASITVKGFTAVPDAANVNTTFAFENNAGVEVSGKAVVKIQDSQGRVVGEFQNVFEDLAPSDSMIFSDTWDRSGAGPDTYHFQAYVLYESRSSQILTLSVPLINLPVMGSGDKRYPTIQEACDDALDNDLIKLLWGAEYTENVVVRLNAATDIISLQGGWDEAFAQRTGIFSTINGTITITNGGVIMDGISIGQHSAAPSGAELQRYEQ